MHSQQPLFKLRIRLQQRFSAVNSQIAAAAKDIRALDAQRKKLRNLILQLNRAVLKDASNSRSIIYNLCSNTTRVGSSLDAPESIASLNAGSVIEKESSLICGILAGGGTPFLGKYADFRPSVIEGGTNEPEFLGGDSSVITSAHKSSIRVNNTAKWSKRVVFPDNNLQMNNARSVLGTSLETDIWESLGFRLDSRNVGMATGHRASVHVTNSLHNSSSFNAARMSTALTALECRESVGELQHVAVQFARDYNLKKNVEQQPQVIVWFTLVAMLMLDSSVDTH